MRSVKSRAFVASLVSIFPFRRRHIFRHKASLGMVSGIRTLMCVVPRCRQAVTSVAGLLRCLVPMTQSVFGRLVNSLLSLAWDTVRSVSCVFRAAQTLTPLSASAAVVHRTTCQSPTSSQPVDSQRRHPVINPRMPQLSSSIFLAYGFVWLGFGPCIWIRVAWVRPLHMDSCGLDWALQPAKSGEGSFI